MPIGTRAAAAPLKKLLEKLKHWNRKQPERIKNTGLRK
jgi:hypothetical protein